jgi:hypothetical protein
MPALCALAVWRYALRLLIGSFAAYGREHVRRHGLPPPTTDGRKLTLTLVRSM